MWKNYLSIAYRSFIKHKAFSFINVLGLSVGLASCILLALYIKDEFSYERHLTDYQHIHRLYTVFVKDGVEETFPRTSPPIAPALAAEVPEVLVATRAVEVPEVDQHLLRYQDKVFGEKSALMVDSAFFDVFSFPFKEGDPKTALKSPSTVVLSAKVAEKIFGDLSPIDEFLIIHSGQSVDTFRITGVLEPFVAPSHIQSEVYMNMHSRGSGNYLASIDTWAWQNFMMSYVKLRPDASIEAVHAKMADMMEMHAGADLKAASLQKSVFLQPIKDIRLYSDFNNSFGMSESGNIQYVYILATIGLFILLIACINFMNLTTAKAAQRAGEIGVRKSLGATRQHLMGQFLGESLLIVTVAMAVAVFLVGLCLPIFNQVTEKQLILPLSDWAFWVPAFLGIGLFTALIAGSYPAFFLSSFQAVDVLKNKRMTSGGAEGLRKGLVVFQFVIAICLISSIVVIREQLHFLQSKPLGFNPSHRIMVPLRSQEAKSQYSNLANAFQQTTGVKQVSATRSLPSTPMLSDFFAYKQGTGPEQAIALRNTVVDEGYFEALDIPLLAGRGLRYETDSFSWSNTQRYVVVNKACLDMLKVPLDDALGTQILMNWEGDTYFHEVVGVTDDFHQFSLHQPIAPLLFYIPSSRNNYNYLVAEVDAASYTRVLEAMGETWKQTVPVTPFEPDFLAENVRRQYRDEERVAQIITGFTTLAILISCLGLYGLSVFVTERRVKEIGVRKVLGGTVTSIITLLSRQFIQLVLIAFFIAVPIGYLAMQQWLQNFAYKITLGLGVFALTGTMAIVLALVTVAYQSVKAATSNPVDSLRSE